MQFSDTLHNALANKLPHDKINKVSLNMEGNSRNMLGICYFTHFLVFITSPATALPAIPYVDIVICSNVLILSPSPRDVHFFFAA